MIDFVPEACPTLPKEIKSVSNDLLNHQGLLKNCRLISSITEIDLCSHNSLKVDIFLLVILLSKETCENLLNHYDGKSHICGKKRKKKKKTTVISGKEFDKNLNILRNGRLIMGQDFLPTVQNRIIR